MATSQEIKDSTWQFLRQRGLNEKSSAAIMGNIQMESSFDPNLVEVGNGIGFGLCQWSFGRRTQLEAYGTDLTHQLNFLWAELSNDPTYLSMTGADFQWINQSGYLSHSDFMAGNGSIADLTRAFCFSWERPNMELSHIEERITWANTYFTQYTGTVIPGDEDAQKVENAVQWAIGIADDNTHGYDQTNRWGPDYDCSSLIIQAYEQAGIPVKTNGATYTGDMETVFIATGFHAVDFSDPSTLVRGDVLINTEHHTAMYIGGGKVVNASQNENGGAIGGVTGDQTGTEIYVRDYYDYPWNVALRYKNGSNGGTTGNAVRLKNNQLYGSSQLFPIKFNPIGALTLVKYDGDIAFIKSGNITYKVPKNNVIIST